MHSAQDIKNVSEEANKIQEKYEEVMWKALYNKLEGKKDARDVIKKSYGLQAKNIKEKASQFLFVEQKCAELRKIERLIAKIEEDIRTEAKKGLYEANILLDINRHNKESYKKMCDVLIGKYFTMKGFNIETEPNYFYIDVRIFWSENDLIKQKK